MDVTAHAGVKLSQFRVVSLLSRKSNLRSLTRKELQMHKRRRTGVSIYERQDEVVKGTPATYTPPPHLTPC